MFFIPQKLWVSDLASRDGVSTNVQGCPLLYNNNSTKHSKGCKVSCGCKLTFLPQHWHLTLFPCLPPPTISFSPLLGPSLFLS